MHRSLIFNFLVHKGWSDYYTGTPVEYTTGTSQIAPDSDTAYVKNTVFKELYPSTKGGAILCDCVDLNFLAEEISFVSCHPDDQGGAMYMIIIESVCSKICSFNCSSQNEYCHFDYLEVENNKKKKNTVILSSICHSKNGHECGDNIYHSYGKIVFNNDNVSRNECHDNSAITSEYQSAASNDYGVTIEYSSICNNTSKGESIIYLLSSKTQLISSCNILLNSHESSKVSMIYAKGTLYINDSSILRNTGKIIISAKSGFISNCSIDFTSSSVKSALITNEASKSYIHEIDCLSTVLCEAFYDRFDDMTNIPSNSSGSKAQNKAVRTIKRGRSVWKSEFVLVILLSNALYYN